MSSSSPMPKSSAPSPALRAHNEAQRAAALAKRERERRARLAALYADHMDAVRESGLQRPRTRGECVDGPRPCPWASCRHHLHNDGALSVGRGRRPTQPLDDPDHWTPSTPTCALDLAEGERVGMSAEHMTLDAVGEALGGISRERVRQIEEAALAKLAAASEGILRPYLEPETPHPQDPRARAARVALAAMRRDHR